MMKKSILALAIAAAMMVSPAAVFADETEGTDEVVTFSYEDIDDSVYDGTWVSFIDGFDMYLPSDWDVVDPTTVDGAEDAGIYFMAQSPEENADGAKWSVIVAAVPDVNVESVEQIYDELSADDTTSGEAYADLNGIGAVGFDIVDNDVTGVAFADDEGTLYTVQFAPSSDEDYLPYVANMLMSISPSEELETEAE